MPRKKWSPKTELTPELLKLREKRKWQIALRRYVLNKNPCVYYAPFFGLDIENLRNWFEIQFDAGIGWADFAKKWQFDQIVSVTHFDFSDDPDLKLCWSFINLRVEHFNNSSGNRLDVLTARLYFEDLLKETGLALCQKMLEKIEKIVRSEQINSENQKSFIIKNKGHLDTIEKYSSFEFELLNNGTDTIKVKKEIDSLKNLEQ